MFEDMVVSSSNPIKTNKPWTVVLSMVFQVLFLGILILIPLIYTEALPKTHDVDAARCATAAAATSAASGRGHKLSRSSRRST